MMIYKRVNKKKNFQGIMFIIFSINYLIKKNWLFSVNVTMLMIKVNVYLFIMLCYVFIQDMWIILGGLSSVNRSAKLGVCRNCKGRRINLFSNMLLLWWHVPR